ncbi:galactokinase [Actinomadura sp. HBU206391]|uniref:galactokinase n=1 Tax=Actinomadura sp. HBU206391 TaxID=2731692 RepID=UPI001650A851|nr:galactokinase [Actinomadura sp. HBU206391]MBC6456878.1 galactokinase [Actinomadura sp. HBU206391]
MSDAIANASRDLDATFQEAYRRPSDGIWHAPGRVNLIGEHTDYNDGLVLPFALAQGVSVAAAAREDEVLELRSLQAAGEAASVPLDGLAPGAIGGWAGYAAGVAWALGEAGHRVRGASLLIDSDLPQGAGLSSSAALECAVALTLCELSGIDIPRPELARIAQRAENDFVGMPCGIMDQSAALLCTADHALLLDCRSGLSTQVPLDLAGLTLLVIDTRAPHQLVDGAYASRRAECERAADALGVPALRDVTDLTEALASLDDPVWRRRVRHVVTENHRVEATVGLLRAGAVTEVGAMLTAAHLSLRDQFEVSWPEADVAVEAAVRAGARGGRMVGGGFGGSAIALVPSPLVGRVCDAALNAYEARGWRPPAFLTAVPSPGARRLA